MSFSITGNNGSSNVYEVTLDNLPDRCPHCHRSIRPILGYGFFIEKDWQVFMNCPNKECRQSFIGYYKATSTSMGYYVHKTSVGILQTRQFPTSITDTSKSFVKIYNEAYSAEQQGLLEICGIGYRKSLEFLIKDYSIFKHADKQEEIERRPLMQCINQYVTDERLKKVAQRATWLGNDETHYVRKWEGKKLEDLKKLIDLTLYWIESEILTESFEVDMPD